MRARGGVSRGGVLDAAVAVAVFQRTMSSTRTLARTPTVAGTEIMVVVLAV